MAPRQPPPPGTHAHHTSHLDTWSLTSSHSINSDSSSPHLIYLAGNCTYTFANCGRSHFPRDRLIVCLPLFSTSTTLSPSGPVSPRIHHLSHWLRINKLFFAPFVPHDRYLTFEKKNKNLTLYLKLLNKAKYNLCAPPPLLV